MARIFILNTTLGFNASGRLVGSLMREAEAAGHSVMLAYSRGEEPDGPQTVRVGSLADRVTHALATRLLDAHGEWSHGPTRHVIRLMEKFEPDVVNLHNIHGYWLNVPMLMRWLTARGVRVIWTLHDFWPLGGHCAFPQAEDCYRWVTGCHSCPLKGEYPSSWLLDRSHRAFERKRRLFTALPSLTLVAVSEWQERQMRSSFLGDRPTVVIHNPVETGIFRPSGTPQHRVVTGAASVWDRRKGLDRFLTLRKLLPEDVEIRLAGLKRRQIATLPAGIAGLERLSSPAALARFYSAGSLFVNLSRAETLGMVNLEARACGSPVVSFDSGGLRETVTGASGLAVPDGDVEAAAAAVMRALDRKWDRAGIAAEIARDFAPGRQIPKYLELFKS